MDKPVKIKKTESQSLEITWKNGGTSDIKLQKLRDECPCVHCQGESVILKSYIPIKAPFKPAGFYEIKEIKPVGNYAVQIIWGDNHDTGIYSWDYLQELGYNQEK
ncbi:MAG: hypothetical protein HGGPFJEG_02846 [Ignavibacteria bacterium]|nr:hypothetical protein [Ignavibacteria bacterium]